MLEKRAYGMITYKGETLSELDEDGYCILYVILYYIILYYIISFYIILYHIILYYIILNKHKPVITGHAFSSNCIEYECNDALSVKEYLDVIKPYLSSIIDYFKTQGE